VVLLSSQIEKELMGANQVGGSFVVVVVVVVVVVAVEVAVENMDAVGEETSLGMEGGEVQTSEKKEGKVEIESQKSFLQEGSLGDKSPHVQDLR